MSRPQGISSQQAKSALRVAFEKYFADCRRQGRTCQEDAARNLYRSHFDTSNHAVLVKHSDRQIVEALQRYAADPSMKDRKEEQAWVANAIEFLKEEDQ